MRPEKKSNLENKTPRNCFGNANLYEKGLEAAQAGQYEQALHFMKEHLKITGEICASA